MMVVGAYKFMGKGVFRAIFVVNKFDGSLVHGQGYDFQPILKNGDTAGSYFKKNNDVTQPIEDFEDSFTYGLHREEMPEKIYIENLVPLGYGRA